MSVKKNKRLSGERDVTPGMENVTQAAPRRRHAVTQQKDTLKDRLQEKDTKQTAHTEDGVNTHTERRKLLYFSHVVYKHV